VQRTAIFVAREINGEMQEQRTAILVAAMNLTDKVQRTAIFVARKINGEMKVQRTVIFYQS
jgi:hypothetical protein